MAALRSRCSRSVPNIGDIKRSRHRLSSPQRKRECPPLPILSSRMLRFFIKWQRLDCCFPVFIKKYPAKENFTPKYLFVSTKKCVPLHYKNPPSLLAMLKSAGRSIFVRTIIACSTKNTCCHHARLWNRFLSLRALTITRPSTPWISNNVQQGRVFFTLCILKHFVDIIRPRNTFKHDLMSLLEKYPIVDTRAMGFPVSWQNEPLWR